MRMWLFGFAKNIRSTVSQLDFISVNSCGNFAICRFVVAMLRSSVWNRGVCACVLFLSLWGFRVPVLQLPFSPITLLCTLLFIQQSLFQLLNRISGENSLVAACWTWLACVPVTWLPYVADLVRFRELFGIDSAHGGYALTSDVSPVLCLIFFAARSFGFGTDPANDFFRFKLLWYARVGLVLKSVTFFSYHYNYISAKKVWIAIRTTVALQKLQLHYNCLNSQLRFNYNA